MTPLLPTSATPFTNAPGPQRLLQAPIGAASPLWAFFAGVTGVGLTYWWMARLFAPANLEAFYAAATPMRPPEPATFEPVPQAVANSAEANSGVEPPPLIGGEAGPLGGAAMILAPEELEAFAQEAEAEAARTLPVPAGEESPAKAKKAKGKFES